MESRGGQFDKTLFFGLQYYLKEYLSGQLITQEDIDKADKFSKAHFGADIFNKEGWQYILDKYNGHLPIRIRAIKEGTLVDTHNVLMTIENTDPKCFWLTNVIETLLMKLWYPITVATNGFYCKKIIANYLLNTGNTLDNLNFKLHCFGYRGVSSEETAGIGGMSHLVNFQGTDTLNAIVFGNDYYNTDAMLGFSVPASEHSVACSFGRDREEEYFENMITQYPTGIVSIVSDTYDVYNFVEKMCRKFKDQILNRQGTIVFRPDSGDPVEVNRKLIEILWNIFGGEVKNGYKLLPPQVRLIQGDGIDINTIDQILYVMKLKGFSTDNWTFGSGGANLQKFDRDTQKFAIKASYGEIDGKGFVISKDPITSSGKKSKPGKLKLIKDDNGFKTFASTDADYDLVTDELEVVFENGKIVREQTFENIREIANEFFMQEINKENV
jgi:nicotinamide phosphoribosyltransferase